MCDECEKIPALLKCFDCDLQYCDECAAVFHKKGTRAAHKLSRLSESGGGVQDEVQGAKANDADDSDDLNELLDENILPMLARRKSGKSEKACES